MENKKYIINHTIMHYNDVVAVTDRKNNSIKIEIPEKMPFGLRDSILDYVDFSNWMWERVDNLNRFNMNKVYIARRIGRDTENVVADSCALSITDKFWIKRTDIETNWELLNKARDTNSELNKIALFGHVENYYDERLRAGTTSLFTTKGLFAKAIKEKHMRKIGGTQEYERVATMIGNSLDIPVQKSAIKSPSISGNRDSDGKFLNTYSDDALVEIELFTNDTQSLVHANELLKGTDFQTAQRERKHHKYFYDRLPNEKIKRKFERILILNWLISNHDMHSENYGCLYSPATFEIMDVTPSYDHNSATFDGTTPELDIPDIVIPNLKHHEDILEKIEKGALEETLHDIGYWLTEEQKDNVRLIGKKIIDYHNPHQ